MIGLVIFFFIWNFPLVKNSKRKNRADSILDLNVHSTKIRDTGTMTWLSILYHVKDIITGQKCFDNLV